MYINKYKRLVLKDRKQICKFLSLLSLAINEYEEVCISIFNLDYPNGVHNKFSNCPKGYDLYRRSLNENEHQDSLSLKLKSITKNKRWSLLSDYERMTWNNKARTITNNYVANNPFKGLKYRKMCPQRRNHRPTRRKFSAGQYFIHEYLKENKTNDISLAWKEWKNIDDKEYYINKYLENYRSNKKIIYTGKMKTIRVKV